MLLEGVMGIRGWIAVTLVAALSVVLFASVSMGDTRRFRAQGCKEDPHWEPTVRRITKGDRIVWKNPTRCEHTVTAYAGKWSKDTALAPGERTAKRFRRTGRYKFRCMTPGHSILQDGVCTGMCGKVRVRR